MINHPIHTGPAFDAIFPLLKRLDSALPPSRIYGVLPVEKVTLTGSNTEKPGRYPLHLVEGGRYERIVPDEHKDILLFFVQTADARTLNWEPGLGEYSVELPLALLISGQLSQINHDPEGLHLSVMNILAGFSPWIGTGFTRQLQDRLFRELDYDFKNHRYLMHPFFGVRIEGTLTYMEKRC